MKNLLSAIIPIFLFLLVFALLILSIIYLSKRTAFVFNIQPHKIYLIYSLTVVFLILCTVLNFSPTLKHLMAVTTPALFGILLILLLSFLCMDFFKLWINLTPLHFGLIVLGLTITTSTIAFYNASHVKLKTVNVRLPKLKEPMNIVQLSDIHLGHYRGQAYLQKLVNMIKPTKAQFVVITGDLFENIYACHTETLNPLKELQIPIYFVDGNHDIYTNDTLIKKMLKDIGVIVLENKLTHFENLQIIGLDYMSADQESTDMMHAVHRKETISSELSRLTIDSEKPSLLLHHNPTGANYAAKAGIGLYLAGHTHGGQLFPLTVINHFAFQFNRGLHQLDQTQIYVSDGCGTFGPPMRLGTSSEITLLHLLPEK